jgi:DNA-binding transcriptional LysR family regulator
MPTLHQRRRRVAVVDHGGFTAASRILDVSQPAASRSVASLEKELGLPLLERNRDGVVATEAGRLAVAHARKALWHWDQLHADIAAMSDGLAGSLRLASLPFTTRGLIEPQLKSFARSHPQVDIRVLEGTEPEIRDWLDRGAADAGVVSLPANGLTSAFLSTQELVAVLPAGHPLSASVEISYAQLAAEPFVLSTGGCAEVFMSVARDHGVEFDVAYEARDMTAVVGIVGAGLAVSILPAAVFDDGPSDVTVRPLIPKTTRDLALAVSASAGPVARAFLRQIDAVSL